MTLAGSLISWSWLWRKDNKRCSEEDNAVTARRLRCGCACARSPPSQLHTQTYIGPSVTIPSLPTFHTPLSIAALHPYKSARIYPVPFFYFYSPTPLATMPGKHVHFVDAPSTPSSTFSDSTIDSDGPRTPPDVYYPLPSAKGKNVYASSYYAPGGVALNPILAHQLANSTPLAWDMTSTAESARLLLPSSPPRLTDTLVRQPATHPALASLSIVCDHLPWSITVLPNPRAVWAAPFVTVGDVLHTLYRTLRLGVTEPELETLEPALRERIRRAYIARYRRVAHPRDREAEKAKYVKRVDFLCDRTFFLGLSPVPNGNPAKGLAPGTVWALHVAKP